MLDSSIIWIMLSLEAGKVWCLPGHRKTDDALTGTGHGNGSPHRADMSNGVQRDIKLSALTTDNRDYKVRASESIATEPYKGEGDGEDPDINPRYVESFL